MEALIPKETGATRAAGNRTTYPFAFKKDSTLGPASITTTTSLAVHSAERGKGCAIIIFAPLGPASITTATQPRAAARHYNVPRYTRRYEPRYDSMERGPYAFLRQYGSYGREY
jgi:hypothetical protein